MNLTGAVIVHAEMDNGNTACSLTIRTLEGKFLYLTAAPYSHGLTAYIDVREQDDE